MLAWYGIIASIGQWKIWRFLNRYYFILHNPVWVSVISAKEVCNKKSESFSSVKLTNRFRTPGLYREISQILNAVAESLWIHRTRNSRWLSVEPALARVPDHWKNLYLTLKLLFSQTSALLSQYSLQCSLTNRFLHIYCFWNPSCQRLRQCKRFESNTTNPYQLLNGPVMLILSAKKMVSVPA